MPSKKKTKQKMGQQPNKYHMTEDGTVYRMNEDGSVTSIGHAEDLDKKSASPYMYKIPPIPTPNIKTAITTEVGWWKRNYNWLWVITFVIFVGWFISCLSCAWPTYYYYENGYEQYEVHNNTVSIFGISVIILLCYWLSWILSKKDKTILKFAQIFLVGGVCLLASQMFWLCEQDFSELLVCLATIPVTMWIITLFLSISRRR